MSHEQRNEQLTRICKNLQKLYKNRKLIFTDKDKDTMYAALSRGAAAKGWGRYVYPYDKHEILLFLTKQSTDTIPQDTHSLVICADKRLLKQMRTAVIKQGKHNCEFFELTEFLICLTESRYQPQFKLLDDNDIQDRFSDTDITKFQHILYDDPISRHYNAKLGNVFEIIRPNNIVGQQVVYRYVTDKYSHQVVTA